MLSCDDATLRGGRQQAMGIALKVEDLFVLYGLSPEGITSGASIALHKVRR